MLGEFVERGRNAQEERTKERERERERERGEVHPGNEINSEYVVS